MIAEINAAVQSVRVLNDLIQAHRSLRNFNEIASALSEVNAKLLTAQSVAMTSHKEQLALSQRIGDLEKEIGELKDWNREAERYHLTTIAPGVPAYCIKPGMEHGEPPHHLCANCFAKREKSFLQKGPQGTDIITRCTRCGDVSFSSGRQPF